MRTLVWLRLLSLHSEIFAGLNAALQAETGLSLAKFEVLAELHRAGDGLSMGQLSRRLDVTSGNVSGLVQRLEASGLITREMSTDDRRSFMVRLSPDGHALFRIASEAHDRQLDDSFGAVPTLELQTIAQGLRSLSAHVRARDHQ